MRQIHLLPGTVVEAGLYKREVCARAAGRTGMPLGRVFNERVGGRQNPGLQDLMGRFNGDGLGGPGIGGPVIAPVGDFRPDVVDQRIRFFLWIVPVKRPALAEGYDFPGGIFAGRWRAGREQQKHSPCYRKPSCKSNRFKFFNKLIFSHLIVRCSQCKTGLKVIGFLKKMTF